MSSRRRRPRIRPSAWLVASFVTLTACGLLGDSRPTRVYTPDVIGPIDDIRNVPGDPLAHEAVVADDVIRYTADEPRDLGFAGSEGALLIYGSEGDDEWFLSTGISSGGELEGCYIWPANAVYDDGTHLIFTVGSDEGIRLPKGEGLELPPPDPDTGRYPSSSGHAYCIESDGTVSRTNLP